MVNATQPQYDVIIIGAGISGINAAQRLHTSFPGCNYTILEARDVMGGTWSLFKYPGIRSDSDLFTFGFPWRQWLGKTRFATGPQITQYIQESAEEYGIDKKIQYKHTVKKLCFSTEKATWTVRSMHNNQERVMTASWVIFGTGYYDYHKPLETEVAGIKNFKGQIIHPQFWPKDLDYKDKKVVIIGSGATAVTILPNMTEQAARVTMVQRSPTYILTLPNAKKSLPGWVPGIFKYVFDYVRYLILPFFFYKWCIAYPNAAKGYIRQVTTKELPPTLDHDPHFNPKYNPWQQRLCMSPDGDFYEALRSGKGDVKTGTIKSMDATSLTMDSGEKVEADIIVTATGLKLLFAGDAIVEVDGKRVEPSSRFIWRGTMLQDVPNCAFVLGYTNASWTLGADCTALLVCRLIKEIQKRQVSYVIPSAEGYGDMAESNVLNLTSTYITSAPNVLPRASEVGPWRARSNYFRDFYFAKFGNITEGLHYR